MRLKKRGQITVFIIIGLLVLLTYFTLSYYRSEKIEEVELILPELIPVQQYVMECTDNLAREAIEIIGINGGYIDFPRHIQTNPDSYLKHSPIDGLKNPYWWYDGKSSIPPLDFMAKQIEDYTKAGMEDCLDNFTAFNKEYEVVELEKFNVIVDIGDEDITVRTIYPIEVRDKFNKTLAELQKFPVNIPIRLKRVYKLAKTIMERENKDYFIEKKVIDLMSLDDDEIPTIGIAFECGRKEWELSKVETKLKSLMSVNLPMIKIRGTNFREDSRVPYYQLQDTNPYSQSSTYNDSYYFHHYIWDVSDINYKNMHASFSYDPKWPIKLHARPSSGGILEANSDSAGGILSLFCINIWHFTYDVVFPVKTTITDDRTKENEPYSFTFAFKGQINHNMPLRQSFSIESFDTRDTYIEEEFCADVTNEITIYAKDQVTTNEIRNVNITFTCGRFECNMGITEPNFEEDETGTPRLKRRFPYCSNGIIRGNKQGYEEGMSFIQTGRLPNTPVEDQIGGTFIMDLRPVKEFNFSIKKHMILNQGVSGAKDLEPTEKAVVTVKNKQEQFESYSTFPLDITSPLKLLDKKQIDYKLEIFVMDNETITAGYQSDWTVTKVDLNLGKNITFHVVGDKIEDDEDSFEFFGKLKTNSKKVPRPEVR